MRSLYTKILLWCLGTLVLSLVAFLAVSSSVSLQIAGSFDRLRSLEAEEAAHAYETGGASGLAATLEKWDRFLPATSYFTDAEGKDLATGGDRSDLLRRVGSRWNVPYRLGGNALSVARSADGRYRLIVITPLPFSVRTLVPYYVLILAAVALLCWILAVNIASPVRALTKTVHRFGAGDLSARFYAGRSDEIGDLAHTFDEMADRMETLLTAERRLLQDISHELRSPLARLSFAAELTRTAEDREAAVGRLKKEIERLTSLVDTLLQVTRAEGDPLARKIELVALDALVAEVVEDCRLEAEVQPCRVVLSNSAGARVRGDRELLRRAIENVLRNAVRYAPEHTTVEVTVRQLDSAATVTVRDYGRGVAEEHLAKIFQPFFRGDPSRDSATGGTGLGLAIAHRAISLHHGEMKASNAQPGLLVSMTVPIIPA